jgi:NADH dehydrogenase FAD-containing subunit
LATVVVVGGGYGGAPTAKALDEIADVVLVEPKDAFVHNIAALRGIVDPDWTDRIFFPYDRLLHRGRVIHDRAARVDADAVILSSGERIEADYIVLASGSAYPFPAKMDVDDSTTAKSKIANTRAELIKGRAGFAARRRAGRARAERRNQGRVA